MKRELSVDPHTVKEDEALAIVMSVLFGWGTIFLFALAVILP